MHIKEAQRIVDDWIKTNTSGYWTPSNMMLALVEEVGELAREVNHRYGEKSKKETESLRNLSYELADVMYALICIANSLEIDMETAFSEIIQKFEKRDKTRHK